MLSRVEKKPLCMFSHALSRRTYFTTLIFVYTDYLLILFTYEICRYNLTCLKGGGKEMDNG